jgi:hypothetical protein
VVEVEHKHDLDDLVSGKISSFPQLRNIDLQVELLNVHDQRYEYDAYD